MENKEVKTYEDYYDQFVSRYEKTTPFIKSINNVDFHPWAFYSIMIASALFAAIRTGKGIYDANMAEGLGDFWSFVGTGLAVWAVEGFVMVYGLNRKRKLVPEGIEKFLEEKSALIALVLGLIISSSAGLKFSLNFSEWLAGYLDTPINLILSITTGLGYTFILFGIGEFMGRQKWLVENLPLLEEQEYSNLMREAWKSSDLFLVATEEEAVASAIAQANEKYSTYGLRKKWQKRNASEIPQAQNAYNKDIESTTRRNKPSPKYTAAMEILRSGIDAEVFTLDTVSPTAIANRIKSMDNGIDKCSPGTVSKAITDLKQITQMENL